MPVRDKISGTSPTPLLPCRFLARSVRARTVALLTVPVVSLMALWALATVSAVQNAWTLHQVKQLNANLAGPIGNLVDNLQAERSAVAQYLAAPRGGGDQAVSAQRDHTTAATAALLDGVMLARADIANLTPDVNRRMTALTRDLAGLQNARGTVTAQQVDWNGAYTSYTVAIEDAFAVNEALAQVQEGQAGAAARVVLKLARMGEMIARQDAVVTSALATGRMTPEQNQSFAGAVGGQHMLADSVLPDLTPADQIAYQRLAGDDSYRSLTAMQNTVLGAGASRAAAGAFSPDQWHGAVQPVAQSVSTLRSSVGAAAAAQSDAESGSVVAQAAATAALGLLAVLLALLVSVRIGRGLVIDLVGLRNSALELANRTLPRAMRRLRAGEKIDIDAEVPVVEPGEGEIGQVGEALNAVQRAALLAAAERAELLTGVSGVFVNLARRSQSLLHRQLDMLEAMERRTEDPATLEDLFRLDHMGTRMRRHAESLIIMSGATPGRAWSRPVPLMNVIRSAIAEVEDYARVEMRRMPELSVVGSVVSDLTHLIAELVENATSFSPPSTTVLVHGEPVGTGFVVEIEDRGLGMRPERMAEANRRIADAHQLDLFDSDRLGLFVVSRLAHRQNIGVSLRRSPYGGTTAVILLPTSILTLTEPRVVDMSRQDRSLTPFDPFGAPDTGAIAAPRSAVATRLPTAMRVSADRQSPAVAWPDPGPAPAPPEPATPAEPPPTFGGGGAAEDVPAGVGDRGDESTGGLPRRIRQASLAPGLRSAGTRGDPSGTEDGEAVAAQVSPEQARAMMSGFQRGFVRGRNASSGDLWDG